MCTVYHWRWRRLLMQKFIRNQLPAEYIGNNVRLMLGKSKIQLVRNYGSREVRKRSFRGRSPAGRSGGVDCGKQWWRHTAICLTVSHGRLWVFRVLWRSTFSLWIPMNRTLDIICDRFAPFLCRSPRWCLPTPRWCGRCRFCLENHFCVYVVLFCSPATITRPWRDFLCEWTVVSSRYFKLAVAAQDNSLWLRINSHVKPQWTI